MEDTVLNAKAREGTGTRAARRFRADGWVPANLYGHGEANRHFLVREDELESAIRDGHSMVTIDLDGQSGRGLLKEIQYDTFGRRIIHVDFARISLEQVVETSVPLNIVGNAKGVGAGGILDVPRKELPLKGRAMDLPESIELDVSDMGLAAAIRAKDLELPEGVEVLLGADQPIVIVQPPRGMDVDTSEEGPSEPEVIGKPSSDDES